MSEEAEVERLYEDLQDLLELTPNCLLGTKNLNKIRLLCLSYQNKCNFFLWLVFYYFLFFFFKAQAEILKGRGWGKQGTIECKHVFWSIYASKWINESFNSVYATKLYPLDQIGSYFNNYFMLFFAQRHK